MSEQMLEQMSDQEWLVRLQFLEEAQEHLDSIESALLGLGGQKLSREALDKILRAAHSIKGGAALMGFHELSQVAHRLEDFFKVLQGGRYEPDGELERLFLSTVDQMRRMLAQYRGRSGIDAAWLQANTQPLLDQLYDRLGNPTAADEQVSLSADAGGEMDVMLFESEIGPCLDRLEGALQEPNLPLLRQEFLIACGEMGGLGEMLDMGQFVSLCNHGLQLCEDCPEAALVEVCQAVLKPLRRSHGLVLVGQAGLIPQQVSLPQGLEWLTGSVADTPNKSSPDYNPETSPEAAPEAALQDLDLDIGEKDRAEYPEADPWASQISSPAEALEPAIESEDFAALADCLEAAGALDDTVELAGLFSLSPQAALAESEMLDEVAAAFSSQEEIAAPGSGSDPETIALEIPDREAELAAAEEISSEKTTIAPADTAILDSLFDDMKPEDFSLEEIASAAPAVEATTEPNAEAAPETADATALEAEALVTALLQDEAFDLDDLGDFAQSPEVVDGEPTRRDWVNLSAIAPTPAQLASPASQESQPENSPSPSPSSSPNKDSNIRVSVQKLERLGELLGELTTERNGLNLQLGYLRNLFTLLNQRVKSLEQANKILRQSYDRGATQLLPNQPPSAFANNAPAQAEVLPRIQAPLTPGFDLLEMDQYSDLHLVSQEIIESVTQIQEVTSDIELALGETETVSRSLNRTAQQLQVGVNQMRMRPLSAITDRFPRLLRELSMAHGKQVDLQVQGGSTLIERNILEAIQDPLMHLLRNCFDHGIEAPETRIAQGKPPQGSIEISASYRGNQVAIAIQDDGAGINLDKIRTKVLTMGLTLADIEASGDAELVNLIFEPGFSTADKVTDLSGRGVGMDVVRSNLRDIQGDITVETSPGQGSTFTLTMPLSLSLTRVLIVECQGMPMAFPVNIVEEMLLLEQHQVIQAAEQTLLEWQGYTAPLLRLKDWLHFARPLMKLETESNPIIDQSSVLIVTHGEEPYAIECDRYWGEQEVTTRTVEGHIGLPQGFSGCVVLGDGRVVPLVEMAKLMDWILRDAQRQGVSPQSLNLPTPPSHKRKVLVIDDSINVRRFLGITLEKAGYQVEQAKDGQDALEKLQDGITPDVIMSDVEMPRLDGFGFLAQVKSLEQCSDIPVIMLTSRSGDKHRQLAMSLGAADYFSKPFKQNELLQTLAQLIDQAAPAILVPLT